MENKTSLGSLIVLHNREKLKPFIAETTRMQEDIDKRKEKHTQWLIDNDMEHWINPDRVKPDLTTLSLRRDLGLTKNSVKVMVPSNPRYHGMMMGILSTMPLRFVFLVWLCIAL